LDQQQKEAGRKSSNFLEGIIQHVSQKKG